MTETATESAVIQPTTRHQLGGGAVRVLCFGLATGDWRLYPNLDTDLSWQQLSKVRMLAQANGIADPNRDLICLDAREFNAEIVNGKKVGGSVVKADGVALQPGQGVFLATGDCPTIVARAREAGHTIVAHAGLKSLVDQPLIETGQRSREDGSVVDTIMKHFSSWTKDLEVGIYCGIGWRSFHHYTEGQPTNTEKTEANRRLINYLGCRWGDTFLGPEPMGQINLAGLIVEQFANHGVSRHQIKWDRVDTAYDRNNDGQTKRWWSHRRWFDEGQNGPDGRDGVFVFRYH